MVLQAFSGLWEYLSELLVFILLCLIPISTKYSHSTIGFQHHPSTQRPQITFSLRLVLAFWGEVHSLYVAVGRHIEMNKSLFLPSRGKSSR